MTTPTTPKGATTKRLAELLERAKSYVMSPQEREAQRQSWVRGEMAIGNDRDEAEYRKRMRERSGDVE